MAAAPAHAGRRSMNDLLLEGLCIEGPAACDIAHGPAFSVVLPAGALPGEEAPGFGGKAWFGAKVVEDIQAWSSARSHREFLCFRTSRRSRTGGPTCPLRQCVGQRRPHENSEIAWRSFLNNDGFRVSSSSCDERPEERGRHSDALSRPLGRCNSACSHTQRMG